MFYTRLCIVGGGSGPGAIQRKDIHWILVRNDVEKAGWAVDYKQYEKILLDSPSGPWGNRPDPDLHYYRTSATTQRAILFHRP